MIGIDLSDKSVKIVEIKGEKNPVLKTLCWSSIDSRLLKRGIVQDVALATEAVSKAMTNCSAGPIEDRDVVASIPERQSFVRVMEVPNMSTSEMDEAIQWAVRRHIPFDLDRVYIDWEDVSVAMASTEVKQILVGAAQKEVVDPLLSVLDNLGLHVIALELEAQAVTRCLLPRQPQDTKDIRGVLIVDLGATTTNIIFFDQGSMRFTTNVQYGGDNITQQLSTELGLDINQAIDLKKQVGLGFNQSQPAAVEIMRGATLNLIHLVEQSIQEMTVQLPPDSKIMAILLTGGGANLVGIKELFNTVFTDIPVQLGNPWTNLQVSGKKSSLNISVGDAMHFTTAIGLALRERDF